MEKIKNLDALLFVGGWENGEYRESKLIKRRSIVGELEYNYHSPMVHGEIEVGKPVTLGGDFKTRGVVTQVCAELKYFKGVGFVIVVSALECNVDYWMVTPAKIRNPRREEIAIHTFMEFADDLLKAKKEEAGITEAGEIVND